MGLPGFFAWIIKKYPNLIVNKPNIIFDILYLDANCLFHPQSYKVVNYYINNNIKIKDSVLEDHIIKRILNFIDFLIDFIKPKEIYIAVDGVAPMAKMSQQRKRRYKSAQDNVIINNIKEKYNKPINNKWNNIVITPGTIFMENLHKNIIKHCKEKINIPFTYSSYHTPGEGEHKILQHIKNNYNNKDKKYIIYGLDADLIFLALASQKNNIYLLREETFFNNKNKEETDLNIVNDVKENLNFVSIDETKECINVHIRELINNNNNNHHNHNHNHINDQRFDRNLVKLDYINDFIFLCYFLGNDFIPNLPSIDIKNDGLDILINNYVSVFSKTNKNLIINKNNNITINNNFLKLYFEAISKYEEYYFRKKLPNYFNHISKRKCKSEDPYDIEMWNLENVKNINIIDPIKLGSDTPELWKFRYYEYYYGVSEYQDKHISNMCYEYLVGLNWITKYYFKECNSWQWYYFYINSPFASDLYNYYKNNDCDINKIIFNNNNEKCITPLLQLMLVIPPSSKNLLPESYQELMENNIDLFPCKVQYDLLYKDMYHKCLPILPVIDISRFIENDLPPVSHNNVILSLCADLIEKKEDLNLIQNNMKKIKLNKEDILRNAILTEFQND